MSEGTFWFDSLIEGNALSVLIQFHSEVSYQSPCNILSERIKLLYTPLQIF